MTFLRLRMVFSEALSTLLQEKYSFCVRDRFLR